MIGLKEIHDLFKRAIKERGEETVAPCIYRRDDGEPGCIVGQVCNYINADFQPSEGDSARNVLRNLNVGDDARMFAQTIQCEQDSGNTWGEAMRKAEAQYRAQLENVGAEFYYPSNKELS